FYGDRVFHFGLIADMDENFETNWDPVDDYSRQGLEITDDPPTLTELIPAYVDDVLVWGVEPEGGTETPDINDSFLYGDVNLDGSVTIVDVVMLNKHLMGEQDLTSTQKKAADCNVDSEIAPADSLIILKSLVDLVSELPVA
ncbi:MAG: dockerin type I repeat-containing protein, partial [Oscillospiraceae bacterium]|nr:dockerin type I repeat-containing protein [Oscillospiraceae bacterium]